jgi:uncharacterized protein (DUF4415 family)
VSKPASHRTLGSDLQRVDAHVIKSPSPRQLISLRLPPEVIAKWRATGPGWQSRMVERLAKGPLPRAKSGGSRETPSG